MVDRLAHHDEVIVLKVESYRLRGKGRMCSPGRRSADLLRLRLARVATQRQMDVLDAIAAGGGSLEGATELLAGGLFGFAVTRPAFVDRVRRQPLSSRHQSTWLDVTSGSVTAA